MGKGSPQAPPAPNPQDTANAQTASNVATAQAQGVINHPNMTTPYGSQTWNQGAGGQWYGNTTLSPEQQALYTSQTQAGQGLTDLANAQIPRVGTALNTQLDTSRLPDPIAMQGDVAARSREVGQSLYDTGIARLQPQFDRDTGNTMQMLADRGIGAGSGEAWTNENRDLAQRQNDARISLSGQATAASGAEQNRLTALAQSLRQGGLQEQDFLRSQPLNDIGKLLGSAPGTTSPQFGPLAPTQIAPTDVVGPINQQYNASLQAYNAQNAQRNGMLGGLFGLGASALGGWASSGFKGLS